MKKILIICILFIPNQAKVIPVTIQPQVAGIQAQREYIVKATCYYPTGQPTSNGDIIDSVNPNLHRWIAISRDMFKILNYNDTVTITGTIFYDGKFIVKDKMAHCYQGRAIFNTIDFLVKKGSRINKWDKVKLKIN